MYGPNLIDVPVKPYVKLLFEEVRWKITLLYCLRLTFFVMVLNVLSDNLLKIQVEYQIEPAPSFCLSLYMLL